MTRSPLQGRIHARDLALSAVVVGFSRHTPDSLLGTDASSLGFGRARHAVHPGGSLGRKGRLEASCAARLGVERVGRPGTSNRFGCGPVGGAERVVRSRRRSWWASNFWANAYIKRG